MFGFYKSDVFLDHLRTVKCLSKTNTNIVSYWLKTATCHEVFYMDSLAKGRIICFCGIYVPFKRMQER